MSADQAARHASLLEAAPSGSATMRHAPAAASGVPFVAQARPSMSTSPTEVDWDRLDKAKFFGVGTGLFTGVTLLLYPFSVIKTRLQISSLPPPSPTASHVGTAAFQPHPQPTMVQVARTIARTEGIPGFYRGLTTVVAGMLPGRVVYMGTLEGVKKATNSGIQALGGPQVLGLSDAGAAGLTSALGGTCASLSTQAVTVPVDVISSRLMAQATQPAHAPRYKGGFDALVTILRTEGVAGLYRGFGMSILTYGPSSFTWWGTYGTTQRLFWNAYYKALLEAPSQEAATPLSAVSSVFFSTARSNSSSSSSSSSSAASTSGTTTSSSGTTTSSSGTTTSSSGTTTSSSGTTTSTSGTTTSSSGTTTSTSGTTTSSSTSNRSTRTSAASADPRSESTSTGPSSSSSFSRTSDRTWRGHSRDHSTRSSGSNGSSSAGSAFQDKAQHQMGYGAPLAPPPVWLMAIVQAVGGSLAGVCAALVTTPLDTVKTRIQVSRSGGSEQPLHRVNVTAVVRRLLAEGGVGAFYKGLLPRSISMALWGTAMVSTYEFLKRLCAVDVDQRSAPATKSVDLG